MTRTTKVLLALLALLVASILVVVMSVDVHVSTHHGQCRNNLHIVETAKEFYAVEHSLITNGAIVTDAPVAANDLDTTYIHGGFSSLKCPDGGTYTIGTLSQPPTCSFQLQDKRHSLGRTSRKRQ